MKGSRCAAWPGRPGYSASPGPVHKEWRGFAWWKKQGLRAAGRGRLWHPAKYPDAGPLPCAHPLRHERQRRLPAQFAKPGPAPSAAAARPPQPARAISGRETSLSPPHERALARALGLPDEDGRIPWAAWHRQQQGQATQGLAWAFIPPCQWQVGTDHVMLRDPQGLDEAASRALLASMSPWFAQDGITLHYDQPTRWLASGALFATLASASLERVLLR